ncbi:nucleotidyltransferase domain-containing protein [Actinoplanes sp. NPDC026619]|uniref:nucleotidyltransferase domain-containing protein n=1 Tax=Actinoplanes sp. NPDC026619 TaxID=3155798 RepID=UPI0033F50606
MELFVHTTGRLAAILANELAARKPSTHRMLARGVALQGDPGDLPAQCARTLAAGPPPLTKPEKDRLRYALTDTLDDYTHATNPGEREVIATQLWIETAQAELALTGRWISSGKWLLRELRESDPAFATRWLAARTAPAPLATQVLAGAGGPLFDGYRA